MSWKLDVKSGALALAAVDRGAYSETSEENKLYFANVIGNAEWTVTGKPVDANRITKRLLRETEAVEANVATGYYAIEFSLWGQDLNGTGPGTGNRPHTYFNANNCTGGNCDCRVADLLAATDLLIDDLRDVVAAWPPDDEARKVVVNTG